MKLKFKLLLGVLLALTAAGGLGKYAMDEIKAVSAAYLYGYPLVIMEETRKASSIHNRSNYLIHQREFPDSDFRAVVRPNVDTLYSFVWFDLKDAPHIISMPDTGDRYYVLPFMDAWTNVFESVGTRTTGNKRQEVMIVGPDFKGDAPAGITSLVKSPTNMVWMIARIQTNNKADIENVADVQQNMAVTSLNAWIKGERSMGGLGVKNNLPKVKPMGIVDSMAPEVFFNQLNSLMAEQLPLADDKNELEKFAHLHIAPGEHFNLSDLNVIQRWAVKFSIKATKDKIRSIVQEKNPNENGWSHMLNIGKYGTNYPLRSVISRFGLGALEPIEASYPNSDVDADGEVYDGSMYRYVMNFPADKLPPVSAFWSLTLYDQEGFMSPNNIDRYSIGDRSNLKFNSDGSLTLYIQHEPPVQGTNNWLPTPNGPFNLLMRLYLVDESYLSGEWNIPAITKVQ